MDYRGQKLAEYIYSIIVILFGAVAWIVGYVQNDFVVTFYGWAAGLAISLVLCIPDWPMFNRNKVVWLEEIGRPNKAPKVKSSNTNKDSSTATKKTKKVA